MDGFLVKPVEAMQLYEALGAVLAGGAAQAQLATPARGCQPGGDDSPCSTKPGWRATAGWACWTNCWPTTCPRSRGWSASSSRPCRRRTCRGPQDALHSLLGMSGEAGALALYQLVRRVYVPVLEERRWPAAADWLQQVQVLAACTEQALRDYGGAARSVPRRPSIRPWNRASRAASCSSTTTSVRASGSRAASATSSRSPPPPAPTRRWPCWPSAASEFAVLVTDYRMPEQDGMELLRRVQRDYRHIVRLLATAYAEKDVAIAAVNQGKVLRILEKPLEDEATREALREALALHRAQALERAMNEGRVAALRETLGFLAHELNTPLATVRGCVASVASRHLPPTPDSPPGIAQFEEHQPGELLAALERAERRALYCQSLVSTFVQSARDAYPGAAPQTVSAGGPGGGAAATSSRSRATSAAWVGTARCGRTSACRAGATCCTWCCAR